MEILACGNTGIAHPHWDRLLGNATRANGDLLQLVYCLSKGQRLASLQQGGVWFLRRYVEISRAVSTITHQPIGSPDESLVLHCCTFMLSLSTKWGWTKARHKLTHSSFSLNHKDMKRAFSLQGPMGIFVLSLLLPFTVSTPAQEGHRILVTLVRT